MAPERTTVLITTSDYKYRGEVLVYGVATDRSSPNQAKIFHATKPVSTNCRLRRPRFLIVLLTLLGLCGSCVYTSREGIIYHAFDYPLAQKNKSSRASIPETIMIYRFLLSQSVGIDSLVISKSKGQDQSSPLHRWQENPADMVTELVLRDFENAGLFEKTVDQLSSARYRYALEGTITDLRGLIRDDKAAALIEAEVSLTDFESRAGAKKNLMKRRYRIEVPSSGTDPASIVRALNIAVKDLSERLRRDVESVIE